MMNRNEILRTTTLNFFALLAVASLVAVPTYANDEVATRAAFFSWQPALYDVPKQYGGVPLPDVNWRFVEAKDYRTALGSRKVLTKGVTGETGKVLLDDQQRQTLFDTWKRAPEALWFIYNSNPLKVTLRQTEEKYAIVLVRPETEWERKRRLAEEQAQRDRNTPLSPSVYTQPGFNAGPFVREYVEWQQRFKLDLDDMTQALRRDPSLPDKLSRDGASDELDRLFSRSVQPGKKGRSFKKWMAENCFRRYPVTEGTEVTPRGFVATRLMLSPYARPVGFGGNFQDDGHTVELWYMVFNDLSGWNMEDFKTSHVFAAFSSARLPAYRAMVRNSWPALVFTRDDKGKLMLYSVSKELALILNNIYRHQLF